MATLREWLTQFKRATGESVSELVLGWEVDDWESEPDHRGWPDWDRWNVVTHVGDVPTELLDREFSHGFGGNESPNLCAWSPSWIVFSDNYDGAEGPCWVPRHPTSHVPIRPGGG